MFELMLYSLEVNNTGDNKNAPHGGKSYTWMAVCLQEILCEASEKCHLSVRTTGKNLIININA